VTANMAAVLDGATVRIDTGCIHGVPWFVENLAGALVKHKEVSPANALTAAIAETAAAHRDTCDLNHPGTPSAALAIAQVRDDSLRYLVLGDVTLAIETTDGLRIITDNRVDSTAMAERAVADAPPAGSLEKAEALIRMKHAELAARNVSGGFWVAAADPRLPRPHELAGRPPRAGHPLTAQDHSQGRSLPLASLPRWRYASPLSSDLPRKDPAPIRRTGEETSDTRAGQRHHPGRTTLALYGIPYGE